VPTWNYVAVHVHGTLSILPQDQIHDVLAGLTASMEERLAPKKPWVSDKMDQEAYERMLRQIVPVKMSISKIDSTWKLNQNKADEVRLKAADAVSENGIGSELDWLSQMMRDC